MTPLGALHVLILELFSVQEFRHWLRHGGYADIVPFLPGDSAIDADVVDQALRALARRARINEAFFRHLVNARPLQKAAVLSVAALWSKSKKPGPSHESPAPIGGDRRHTLIGGRDLSLRLPRGIFTGSFALVVIIAVAWALWRALHSEVAPARAGDPGIALNAVAPMKFVKIAGGRFKMGSPASERDRFIPDPSKELPYPSNLSAYFADESLRMVEVSPFEMAITEVTNSQWTAVMGTMPPSDCTYGCGPNHPVSLVTWVMAVEYLNKLTDLENLGISPTQHRTRCYRQQGIVWKWVRGCTGYRLPSEIEWEYAARAGTETAYGFGDDVKDLCKHANGADLAWKREHADDKYANEACDDGAIHLANVQSYGANLFGLYDMHGNVWEWVWGGHNESDEVVVDFTAPRNTVLRMLRGGSFRDNPWWLRVALRYRFDARMRTRSTGFRCVRALLGGDQAPDV